jgi:hypothetical protein
MLCRRINRGRAKRCRRKSLEAPKSREFRGNSSLDRLRRIDLGRLLIPSGREG